MAAAATDAPPLRQSARPAMTPVERARERCPSGELLMTDHAGQLTEQLEQALAMLAVAVGLLAQVTGYERSFVVWTLEQAAALISTETAA